MCVLLCMYIVYTISVFELKVFFNTFEVFVIFRKIDGSIEEYMCCSGNRKCDWMLQQSIILTLQRISSIEQFLFVLLCLQSICLPHIHSFLLILFRNFFYSHFSNVTSKCIQNPSIYIYISFVTKFKQQNDDTFFLFSNEIIDHQTWSNKSSCGLRLNDPI